MKRSDRMAPVQRVLGNAEKDRARDVGSTQRQLEAAEEKLQSLQQYHREYMQGFEQRARTGQTVMALRDYQLFLARLQEAIRQQEQVVAQAREAVAASKQRWQSAAKQVKAVDSVVNRWVRAERQGADRQEQRDSDERAQRGAAVRAQGDRS